MRSPGSVQADNGRQRVVLERPYSKMAVLETPTQVAVWSCGRLSDLQVGVAIALSGRDPRNNGGIISVGQGFAGKASIERSMPGSYSIQ